MASATQNIHLRWNARQLKTTALEKIMRKGGGSRLKNKATRNLYSRFTFYDIFQCRNILRGWVFLRPLRICCKHWIKFTRYLYFKEYTSCKQAWIAGSVSSSFGILYHMDDHFYHVGGVRERFPRW